MWVDADEENSGIMRDFVPYHPTKNNIREPRARNLVREDLERAAETPQKTAREKAASKQKSKKAYGAAEFPKQPALAADDEPPFKKGGPAERSQPWGLFPPKLPRR